MAISTAILAALKNTFVPGLVLQFFALIILLVYFLLPEAKPYFDFFGALKEQHGFLYSFAATALFGGLIPFLYLWCSGKLARVKSLIGVGVFYVAFWGYKGMEVDLFYRWQAHWFGSGSEFATLATKVAVDQLLYSAMWAAPSITLSYLWMEVNFSWQAWRAALNRQLLTQKLPVVIVSNWLVWIPAVSVIYSMPSQLQIPLFNLVLCFWVLLLAVLNKPEK
jgi:hypothetical protein